MLKSKVHISIYFNPGENPLEQSSCPIAGQYNGVLPDSSQLCAKITSDCNNLVIIHIYGLSIKIQSHQIFYAILEHNVLFCYGV